MGRSIRKGPYVDAKLMKKVELLDRSGQKRPIKTWARRSMIIPEFIGHTFSVHNGKVFNSVFVTENMVGHRLGEFSPTRTFRKHGATTDKTVALK
ncbi:MAG: 30S ribosomal protein S19 [Kiritimatiellae bacterium]|nr:30S ribosomal protein S19 [Kiritimatiellia bacterium]MCO5044634.1 30S ribosomal protein S19 [Kiritimatiellia bacterium]MCO5060937.1 30S ribosomal protein S19 [Kiritimatiellia bacterium]MCO5068148.1 30S ribosomal protein S19 [Kiritimatiellia bacterium]MCO6400832.1 30S ribosomal protein S19 [Verrucomicrobiota bacterium]